VRVVLVLVAACWRGGEVATDPTPVPARRRIARVHVREPDAPPVPPPAATSADLGSWIAKNGVSPLVAGPVVVWDVNASTIRTICGAEGDANARQWDAIATATTTRCLQPVSNQPDRFFCVASPFGGNPKIILFDVDMQATPRLQSVLVSQGAKPDPSKHAELEAQIAAQQCP
jgi:hypothetical protein